jgi:hypothetical protein
MADDGKRTEVLCTKATERVALDLLRASALDDVTPSEYIYRLLREHLYGRMISVSKRTGVNEVDQ